MFVCVLLTYTAQNILCSSCKGCVTLGSLHSGVGNSQISLPAFVAQLSCRETGFYGFYGITKGATRKFQLLHDSHLSMSYSGMIVVGETKANKSSITTSAINLAEKRKKKISTVVFRSWLHIQSCTSGFRLTMESEMWDDDSRSPITTKLIRETYEDKCMHNKMFVPVVSGIKAKKGSASPHQQFQPFWLFSAPGWPSGWVQVLKCPFTHREMWRKAPACWHCE